jgi:hypothetical protein
MRAIPGNRYVSILLQYSSVNGGRRDSAVGNAALGRKATARIRRGLSSIGARGNECQGVSRPPPPHLPLSREHGGAERGLVFSFHRHPPYQCRTAILTFDPAGSRAVVNSGIQTTIINSMNNPTTVISLMTATSYSCLTGVISAFCPATLHRPCRGRKTK